MKNPILSLWKKICEVYKTKWLLHKPGALPLNEWLGNPNKEYSWKDWKRDNQKAFPIRYWLQEDLTLWFAIKWRQFITEPLYWLRTHTIHRYHILDLRHPGYYEWGWIDRSHAIMAANFNLLKDFVEKEKAFDCHVNWDGTPHHSKAKKEMLDLYNWWMTGRKQEQDNLDKIYDKKGIYLYMAEETRLEKKDTEQLIRLIKVRGYMWT